MQYFKGDDREKQFYQSGRPAFAQASTDKDLFFGDAYHTFALGDMLHDSKRAPLTNAIVKSIFRESFAEIFQAFAESGNFESYLTVFRKIFGDDVDVTFTVPDPGKLEIDIIAQGLELSELLGREIVSEEYQFFGITDDEENQIMVQGIKGFETQYEVEQMLFELVPAGIATTITLTLGSEA
jgi:hypothetical protein